MISIKQTIKTKSHWVGNPICQRIIMLFFPEDVRIYYLCIFSVLYVVCIFLFLNIHGSIWNKIMLAYLRITTGIVRIVQLRLDPLFIHFCIFLFLNIYGIIWNKIMWLYLRTTVGILQLRAWSFFFLLFFFRIYVKHIGRHTSFGNHSSHHSTQVVCFKFHLSIT